MLLFLKCLTGQAHIPGYTPFSPCHNLFSSGHNLFAPSHKLFSSGYNLCSPAPQNLPPARQKISVTHYPQSINIYQPQPCPGHCRDRQQGDKYKKQPRKNCYKPITGFTITPINLLRTIHSKVLGIRLLCPPL